MNEHGNSWRPLDAAQWHRTHTCGELTAKNVGDEVVLTGWINRRRDHGSVTFLNVRDRYGVLEPVEIRMPIRRYSQ